jgi:hypothetical protein
MPGMLFGRYLRESPKGAAWGGMDIFFEKYLKRNMSRGILSFELIRKLGR